MNLYFRRELIELTLYFIVGVWLVDWLADFYYGCLDSVYC